jgi:hypothetical protein
MYDYFFLVVDYLALLLRPQNSILFPTLTASRTAGLVLHDV